MLSLVGLNKNQIVNLPHGIIGIERTQSIQELTKWYTAAAIFFNPTYEDNYPTVNLEAISCGAPVITAGREVARKRFHMIPDVLSIKAI